MTSTAASRWADYYAQPRFSTAARQELGGNSVQAEAEEAASGERRGFCLARTPRFLVYLGVLFFCARPPREVYRILPNKYLGPRYL